MKNPWVILGVIAVALIGGAVWYSSTVSTTYNEGVTVQAHLKGNPDAPVKLVEYSDFQCPACAAFQPVVAEILAEFGDSVSFEYRHFPLMQIHPLAEPAARAAEAAGQQDKFFEFHDLLFANQATWSKSSNPGQFFTQYATELGLDLEQFARQQRASVLQKHVRAQFDEARSLGLTGTPSFYLNGHKMTFASYEEFRAQIAAAVNPAVDLTPGDTSVATSTATTTATTAGAAVQFGL